MGMLLALLLTAQAAPAPDWRPLGTVRDQYRLAWDAASVEHGAEVVTVRFRTEAAQSPATSPRLESRLEIRCAPATMRVVETVTYAPDGSVTRRDTVPAPFEAIGAGSFVAIIQRSVCQGAAQPR